MNTAAATNNTVNVAPTITANDIINGGKWESAKDFSDEEHYNLIMDMGHSGLLFKDMNDEQAENVAHYAISLRFGPLALLWWVLTSGKTTKNVISVAKVRDKNGMGIQNALAYLMKNDSSDKNNTFLRCAQRAVGVEFKIKTPGGFKDMK